MSLIPTADQGSAGVNYFVAADGGTARNLTILPTDIPSGVLGKSAVFAMNNGGGASPMNVVHYVNSVAGGGLVPGLYQVFMYGPTIGGSTIAELSAARGIGNNNALLSFNSDFPLDITRRSGFTGTGAPQTFACPSILATSSVFLTFVGGTPAAGAVPITIVPNTSFTLTVPAGAAYSYEVVG